MGLACEGVWARYLAFFTNFAYGFTNLLGTYLLGLGAGSLLYRAVFVRLGRRVRLLAAVELAVGLAVLLCFSVGALVFAGTKYAALPSAFTMALVTVLLPAVLMGVAFPLLITAYAPSVQSVGRSVASLRAEHGRFHRGRAAADVRDHSRARRAEQHRALRPALLRRGRPAAGPGRSPGPLLPQADGGRETAGLVVVLALALPHDLCGVFKASSPNWGARELSFWEEGRTATAIVVRDKVNNLRRSTSTRPRGAHPDPDMLCFKLMGSLGPLLHPQPDRVLIVAFGGGVAAGTVAVPGGQARAGGGAGASVVGAAQLLKAQNNAAYADPKVHITIQDGRNYLLNHPDRYPSSSAIDSPEAADSWVLYTQEFYRTVQRRRPRTASSSSGCRRTG